MKRICGDLFRPAIRYVSIQYSDMRLTIITPCVTERCTTANGACVELQLAHCLLIAAEAKQLKHSRQQSEEEISMKPYTEGLHSRRTAVLLLTLFFTLAYCASLLAASTRPECDPGNGGIDLPDGFCALIFADELGSARHLTVSDNGDVYARLRKDSGKQEGTIVALRDTTGDGRADRVERFAEEGGTGIVMHSNYLYFSTETAILRYPLRDQELTPQQKPQIVVERLTARGQHAAKSFTFDQAGNLYVNIGAPANACQRQSRTPGSPGLDPCPLLEDSGGVWRFASDQLEQRQNGSRERFASGIRNAVALRWHASAEQLYAVQHGRDQLHGLWPDLYSAADSAVLPAEQMLALSAGESYGWPYCYYDQRREQHVLAPEYGGDGVKTGRCAKLKQPAVAFPGHWAPNDLLFYGGSQFPARYRGAAFVAFHGSWNRSPLPQAGFKVVVVPFSGDKPGAWEEFATGFAGIEQIKTPAAARYRPTGLAQGPDGSLYIADSVKGRIWRVIHTADVPAEAQ